MMTLARGVLFYPLVTIPYMAMEKMGHGVRMLFLLAQSFLRLNMGRDPPIHIQREIETNYT